MFDYDQPNLPHLLPEAVPNSVQAVRPRKMTVMLTSRNTFSVRTYMTDGSHHQQVFASSNDLYDKIDETFGVVEPETLNVN